MAKWIYPECVVVGVHDGDTITVDIDLGQEIWIKRRTVRLAGIAARELGDEGGVEAREALAALLPLGTVVRIVSTGWDKYAGRIDGIAYLDGEFVRTAQSVLVREGWAVAWNGRGPQPKPPWPRRPP